VPSYANFWFLCKSFSDLSITFCNKTYQSKPGVFPILCFHIGREKVSNECGDKPLTPGQDYLGQIVPTAASGNDETGD